MFEVIIRHAALFWAETTQKIQSVESFYVSRFYFWVLSAFFVINTNNNNHINNNNPADLRSWRSRPPSFQTLKIKDAHARLPGASPGELLEPALGN